MKLDTLYKKDNNDGIREWTIEIQDGAYRTHSGIVGGKIVTSGWFKTEATNTGRANARNVDEQALFEAQAKWQKKIDSGYNTNVSACRDIIFQITPMLAKKWEDRKDKISFPLASQPKLDGMRCLIDAHGAWTRSGKRWMTVDFLTKELKGFFDSHPYAILDGELYSHELKHDFNKISSLIKKTKPTAADLHECESKIKYHVYDCILDPQKKVPFTTRIQSVTEIVQRLPQTFVAVATSMANNQAELDTLYGQYLEDGYEGQMVRLPDSPYELKRSAYLLKRKEFQDDEYEIVEIGEGNGNKAGMAGFAVLRHPDGRIFNSNIKGSHEFLKELLERRDSLVGTYATCTFFNLTPDGIPRFPYITKLRDGRGID